MITFTRTASVAPGKNLSAISFAREIVAYIKNKVGVEFEVLVPVGGNPNRITWSCRYQDLAAYEKATTTMAADMQYMQLALSGTENFIAGSFCDSIWRVV
jgi:hypothetical protein